MVRPRSSMTGPPSPCANPDGADWRGAGDSARPPPRPDPLAAGRSGSGKNGVRVLASSRREMMSIGGAAALAALWPRHLGAVTPAGNGPLLAPTPPMGWNSWHRFATTVTEAQPLAGARLMQKKPTPIAQ